MSSTNKTEKKKPTDTRLISGMFRLLYFQKQLRIEHLHFCECDQKISNMKQIQFCINVTQVYFFQYCVDMYPIFSYHTWAMRS